MKPINLIMSGLILTFLIANMASGQDNVSKALMYSPLNKGNMLLNLSNDLGFRWNKLKTDNESAGTLNSFGLHYEGTYMIIDHVGVGIGISSDRSREKDGDFDDIESSILGSVHALYGGSVGGIVNLYGKAGVRAGRDRSKYEYTGYSEDSKYNEFGLNIEAGAPLAIGEGSGFLITPYLAYDYGVSKDDDYKDASSGIYLGTRLNLSLPCSSFAHNCSQVQEFSENMYNKGTNVLGGSTFFSLNSGSETDKYIGSDPSFDYNTEYSNMGGAISALYHHYLLNNVALGGELSLSTAGYKNKDTDNKQNFFSWMLEPEIQANLPVKGAMHNTFFFVGYGFGGAKDKTTFVSETTETTETKYSNSEVSFGAGHNVFVAKGFALVPKVNYSMFTQKNKDTEIKFKENGLQADIALRYSW